MSIVALVIWTADEFLAKYGSAKSNKDKLSIGVKKWTNNLETDRQTEI